MFRNTKFYVALALIAQSVASIVACIVLAAKKKAMSAIAFLAVGGVSGAAGAYLMAQCADEEREFEEYCDGDCENCAEFEECAALEDCDCEDCDCEDCEDVEDEEVAEEEVDFELDGGEAFSRIAEAKDID
jgi:hypothetical protein